MILSRSTSSVIILGLLHTLAQTPSVGAVPHNPDSGLSDRASIESIGNDAANLLQRVWKGISCMGECRTHWGWTGKHFGGDPWGPVVLKGDPIPYPDESNAADGNSSQSVGSGTASTRGVTTTATPTIVFSVFNVPTLSSTSSTDVSSSSFSEENFVATSSSSSSEEPTPTPTPETTTNPPEPETSTPADNQGNDNQENQGSGNNNNNNNNNNNQGGSNTGGSTGSGGNSVSGDDQFQYLQEHNNFRAQHGAAALTWSDQLAGIAQEWANNCQFQHSGGRFGRVGENLAAGTGFYGIPEMVGGWTSEVNVYDPNNPQASHFTQVVWKGTTQVGCAKATCGGIFEEGGSATFYVCEYLPAGNVIGQFGQNVQK